MRSLIDSLFDREEGPGDPSRPRAGDICAFRTSASYPQVRVAETGRWAAYKVLAVTDDFAIVATLDGVWTAPPTFAQARKANVLINHRFAHTGSLAVHAVFLETWSKHSRMQDLVFLGRVRPTGSDKALARANRSYARLDIVAIDAEGEWRWAYDRHAFVAERDQDEARRAADDARQVERHRNRLSKLTWAQLAQETPFERWTRYPPAPFVQEARATIRQACRDLEALGPKPQKASVRRILKACVEWFNLADEKAGGVIETEEREDIMAMLEELAYTARQKTLVEEMDGWREW